MKKMKEVEKLFYKVKKTKDGSMVLLLPRLNDMRLDEDVILEMVYLYPVKNSCHIKIGEVKSYSFQTTRVTNKNLVPVINDLILARKKQLKLEHEEALLREKVENLRNQARAIGEIFKIRISHIPASQNLINKKFLEEKCYEISSSVMKGKKSDYNFYVYAYNSELEIVIKNEVLLKKYAKEGDFSFIYEEYDRELFPITDYETDSQFQKLVNQHFSKTNYRSEDFFAKTGDKGTVYIEHFISFPVPNVKTDDKVLSQIFKDFEMVLRKLVR